MLDYVRTGEAHGDLVAAQRAEPAKLRLLCLSVLGWLSSRGRVPKMTSMATSEAGSARDALVSLVAKDDAFSSTFQVVDDQLTLHPAIDAAVVEQILKAVAAGFKPPVFTTRRRETSKH